MVREGSRHCTKITALFEILKLISYAAAGDNILWLSTENHRHEFQPPLVFVKQRLYNSNLVPRLPDLVTC